MEASINKALFQERERSEFCVMLKILQRHHFIQPSFKING